MDMNKYKTLEFLKAETVKESEDKVAKIIEDAVEKPGKYDPQAIFKVLFNGEKYNYSPNGQTTKNLIEEYGQDSVHWVGQPIIFEVIKKNDKNILIGYPQKVEEEKVE